MMRWKLVMPFALDGEAAGAGHVVEGAPRRLEGGAARVGEAGVAEAVDAADADGDAGGEVEVGGAEPGGQEEGRPERKAGVGDEHLPAVAAKAGEAGRRCAGRPGRNFRSGCGEEIHRSFKGLRGGLGRSDQSRRSGPKPCLASRLGPLQALELDLPGSSYST